MRDFFFASGSVRLRPLPHGHLFHYGINFSIVSVCTDTFIYKFTLGVRADASGSKKRFGL